MINYQLIIHNIFFLSGGIINILVALAVLYVRRQKIDTLVTTFFLMSLSVATFQISHVLGVNASTAEESRQIFMLNLANIPIAIFMTHWFLALIGKTKERRWILGFVYFSGISLFIYFLIYPSAFLLPSVPKMYFPFYYEPGSLQWVMRVWFNIVGVYYFAELVIAYRREIDPIVKNRYAFVLLAIVYGFVVGSTAILLVYNIEFDPMWSSFFGLYIVFISYAVIQYQLLDVRVIIQRAVIYGVSVAALIGFISFSNTLNILFSDVLPGSPSWIVPSVFSVIGVGVGFLIWKKLRENDVLKYEFITVIAHKFRTPLTQIKWVTEEIQQKAVNTEVQHGLHEISVSNEKLVGLTSMLIALSEADSAMTQYIFKKNMLCETVKSIASSYQDLFTKKKINFTVQCPVSDIAVNIDPERMKFVIQTLLENALNYTKSGGQVNLSVTESMHKAYVAISDNGIGIVQDEIPLLFSKFYRSHTGKLADTEGFGIGLYLAQSIVKRHGGKITAFSEGSEKGSTFTVTLPHV